MDQKRLQMDFMKYVGLNVAGMLGLSCYILADTFFIARALGADGLTALNLAIPVYSLISAAGLMLGIGGAAKYTVLRSREQDGEADRIFTSTAMLGLSAGLLIMLAGVFFSSPLAEVLGADQDTLGLTNTYLKVVMCFAPFFIANNILIAFVRNDREPRLAMAAMLAGSLSNVVLDYVLMFPLSMGIFGAAFATGLAPMISMGVLSVHILKKRNGFHPVKCIPELRQVKSVLALGSSTFVTEVSSGIVLVAFNLVILSLEGNVGVAAYGIVANVALVAVAVFTGMAQGVQPLVSQAVGRKDGETLKRLRRYSVTLAAALAVLIYAAVNVRADQVVSLFNREGDGALAAIALEGFRIYFAGFLFAGVNIVASAFLSAAERPGAGFAVSVTRGLAAILLFVLILPGLLGMNGVWLSFVCAEAAAGAITAAALRRMDQSRMDQI